MNLLSLIHFSLLKKFVNRIPSYTWLVWTLIRYLLIFPYSLNICVDNLYNDNENPPNIPKHDFLNLLNIATKETLFMLNNKYYKQVDGVAMVLMISNLCSIDVISMIYLYCFLLLIIQINSESICHLNYSI